MRNQRRQRNSNSYHTSVNVGKYLTRIFGKGSKVWQQLDEKWSPVPSATATPIPTLHSPISKTRRTVRRKDQEEEEGTI